MNTKLLMNFSKSRSLSIIMFKNPLEKIWRKEQAVITGVDLERFDKTRCKIGMLTPRLTIKLMNLNIITQLLQSSQITLNVSSIYQKKKKF